MTAYQGKTFTTRPRVRISTQRYRLAQAEPLTEQLELELCNTSPDAAYRLELKPSSP